MACTTEIYSVSNTINKLQIQYPLYSVYQKNLYHDKPEIIYEIFHQYHLPSLKYIDHPEFITAWRKLLILLPMKIYKQRTKSTIKEERN